MKSKNPFFITLFFVFVIFIGCDQDQGFGKNYTQELEQLLGWVMPFENKTTFIYYNQNGEAASIDVEYKSDNLSNLECFQVGEITDCEYRFVILEFNAPGDTIMYLCIYINGPDHVRVMPSRNTGIVGDFARLDEITNEFRNNLPEEFKSDYVESFTYKDQVEKAFVVENIKEDFMNEIPPKAFTLVKNIGVTEWTDYRGQVWRLNN